MDLKARPNSRLWANAESRAKDAADQYARDFWRELPQRSKEGARDALQSDLIEGVTSFEEAYIGDYLDQWPSALLHDAFGSFFAVRVEATIMGEIYKMIPRLLT